jgi:hypothetical protein
MQGEKELVDSNQIRQNPQVVTEKTEGLENPQGNPIVVETLKQLAIPPIILKKPELVKAAEHEILDLKITLDPSTDAKGRNNFNTADKRK